MPNLLKEDLQLIRIDPTVPTPAGYDGIALVPIGEFLVFIQVTSSSVSYPLTVDITETPQSPISVYGYTLSTGGILDLSRETDICDAFVTEQ